MFPENWQKIEAKNYQAMLDKLDANQQGVVSYQALATYICLASSPLPYPIQAIDYQENLMKMAEDGYVTKEVFVSTPSFYDLSESAPRVGGKEED